VIPTVHLDDLLTSKQAAALLRIKPNTLENWRHKGKGPPFIKFDDTPQSPIRYRRSVVMEFAARRTFKSTSAYSPHSKHNNSGPSNPSV
jgi:hypothetical protein